MTERTDLTTFWEESPRIIEVAAPSTSIINQDLHDTLKSNTEQASENDDSLVSMDDDPLIDSAGKEDLGGGVQVGITSTLLNAQLAFESRLTPAETGTITTGNAAGTTLIDNVATFITNGVTRGAVVINFTDQSIAEVLSVDSETQLTTRALLGGTDDQYDVADAYKVWNIIQCNVAGGNLVAVDDVDAEISPIFPTAFTQVVRAASSSATLANQEDLQFFGAIWIDSIDGAPGTAFPLGTEQNPTDNVPDGITIGADRNIKRFQVRGQLTFASNPPQSEWDGFGGGAGIILAAGANFEAIAFNDVQIIGAVSGSLGMSAVSNATQISRTGFSAHTFTDLHGYFTECLFDASTLRPVLAPLIIVDCVSQTAGPSAGLTIDCVAGAVDVSIRRFSGGVTVSNMTNAGAVMTIEMTAGNIVIDATCTAGTIVCRGIGTITNNAAGTTVNTAGLVTDSKLLKLATWLALK